MTSDFSGRPQTVECLELEVHLQVVFSSAPEEVVSIFTREDVVFIFLDQTFAPGDVESKSVQGDVESRSAPGDVEFRCVRGDEVFKSSVVSRSARGDKADAARLFDISCCALIPGDS
ncbi:MAG: hypothetical protein GDA38_27125 [Hormoscilla sp. SP12CHS1]|nr:hypothetical protein [Hormoscilla sp. SP12CHS1]